MKLIKQHIKENKFLPYYVLYGSEDYLKKLYRDKLKTAMLVDHLDMNYSYFEGSGIEISKIVSIAHTLPFFADKRLIVIENSGLFQTQSILADEILKFPDTTFLVFVEKEVDKRGRLYKQIKTKGYISKMDRLTLEDLSLFVVSELKKNNKKMTETAVRYFVDYVGSDLYQLQNELEKLCCFCMDQEIISEKEIDSVCIEQIENRIFVMMEAIGLKNLKRAMELYFDLILLREKPLVILYLMIRHFNKLMQVKALKDLALTDQEVAEKVGIPPFSLFAYQKQCKNFSLNQMKAAIEYGTDLEFAVKSGNLEEQIAVEIMIAKFAML